MTEFVRNTPSEVADWLRRLLAATPQHPVLRALALDDRMSDLWAGLKTWRPKVWLVQLAVHFSSPAILSALQHPTRERGSLAFAEGQLGFFARHFAVRLEFWRDRAAELWGEPVDALIEHLHSFADVALERGEAIRSVYDYIPEPDRRGRGVREQLAFREALARALERICEQHPLSKQRQDLVVATITGVVFPESDVDVEAIRQHRRRRRKRPRERPAKA